MTTTITLPRRRKGRPYDPAQPVHDRRATDLLRNARVAPVEIDDPFEAGGKIIAMRSVRDDPLAEMKARGQLTECEYNTGRHWQWAYENAEIGGVCGIDPTKEAVDGGRMREVLTDRQVKATKDLKAAREELGHAGNYLIIQVLASRKTLERVAHEWHWGRPSESQRKYILRRFRECLAVLAVLFGYASTTRA